MRKKPTTSKRASHKELKTMLGAHVDSVNMLTDPMEILDGGARRFRRFTRAVFGAHAAILKHGDTMNAHFRQSAARWRVLMRIELGNGSGAEIAKVTGYSRQSVHRLLDVLQKEGLIATLADPADQRRLRSHLTAKGRALLTGMEISFNNWSTALVKQLQASRLDRASAFLEIAAALLQEKAASQEDIEHAATARPYSRPESSR